MKTFVGALVGAAAVLGLAGSANAAATLYAAYDGNFADTSSFRLVTDAFGLQNVTISGTNGNGTTTWGGIAGNYGANTDTGEVQFQDCCSSAFTVDYDDFFFGSASYTISAIYNGHNVSATFSPESNASGGFVGFLGNDSNGFESDAQVNDTVVATLGGAPEPAAWALMISGFGLAGVSLRRRRAATAA